MDRAEAIIPTCRSWSPATHIAAFTLPPFATQVLGSEVDAAGSELETATKSNSALGSTAPEFLPRDGVAAPLFSVMIDLVDVQPRLLSDITNLEVAANGVAALLGRFEPISLVSQRLPNGEKKVLLLASDGGSVSIFCVVADRTCTIDLVSRTRAAEPLGSITAIVPGVVELCGGDQLLVNWTLHPRGSTRSLCDLQEELGNWGLRKRQLVSKKSEWQELQVWEFQEVWNGIEIEHHHERRANGTFRTLYLDGIIQVSEEDEVRYHESLIHPGFLAHPTGAKRVAILGGGDGGALREVLKHRSVEQVLMIEIDPAVSNVSREFLPQLSACNIMASTSCFDDPRVEVLHTDAIGWFWKEFGENPCDREARMTLPESKRFDILVMDLLDPTDPWVSSKMATELYSSRLLSGLSCALHDDGVFITNFGTAPELNSVVDTSDKVEILELLAKVYPHGVKPITFFMPSWKDEWSVVVACKSASCAQRWAFEPARVELALRSRVVSSALPLSHYDGGTHLKYRHPTREWEQAFCAWSDIDNINKYCHNWRNRSSVFDGIPDDGDESTVMRIERNPKVGTAAVAARNIGEDESISGWDAATTFKISRNDLLYLEKFARESNSSFYQAIFDWLDTYGYACDGYEGGQWYTSLLSLMTFVNHGCAGSQSWQKYNLGSTLEDEEASDASWNPVIERRLAQYCTETRMLQNVEAGTPLAEDYGAFSWEGPRSNDAGDIDAHETELRDWQDTLNKWCDPASQTVSI